MTMKFLKALAIVLCLSLALSLCACGDSPENPAGGNVPENAGNGDDAGAAAPAANGEGIDVSALTLQDINTMNDVPALVDAYGTVTVEVNYLETATDPAASQNIEYYRNSDGYLCSEARYIDEIYGTSETVYSKTNDVPGALYNSMDDENWLNLFPASEYQEFCTTYFDVAVKPIVSEAYGEAAMEELQSVDPQDDVYTFITLAVDNNPDYPTYVRALYYVDNLGRIVFKETMCYELVNGEVPDVAFGMDEGECLTHNTYYISYGEDRALNLDTMSRMTSGETCELTVHFDDETQTINVSKDVGVTASTDYFYTLFYTDADKTQQADFIDVAADKAEYWIVGSDDFPEP